MKRLSPEERDRTLAQLEATLGRAAVTAADRERYQFLSWEQVLEMTNAGVDFGSHTVTHPMLSTLDEEALRYEIVESKRVIEARTGRQCYAFAYPNGSRLDFGPRDQAALRSAGYSCALALCGGLNGLQADLFALERVNIGREFNTDLLEAALSGVLGAAAKARAHMFSGHARSRATSPAELNHVAS
jgi:peptidoglycan/xylan/chitin deacetylase (PgdA/CDA1 family)